ncbi:RND family efflux transporter MFP subunit [Povalibacter uvarum]|uniref:RND family efflux transporter MFP subunit n=1 Tax=Povalibacter uvarum TaxID=732238 RepID=A0A841HP74_9GAMM|nr:efflux RND transporter periplasmic adaptor subunit [Povalibacter uvarum]MBB6094139.1 RND family efflux transporter MFP subunit [Povalibacter uvarum]
MKSNARQQAAVAESIESNDTDVSAERAGTGATVARLAPVQAAAEETSYESSRVAYNSGSQGTEKKPMKVWILLAAIAVLVAGWFFVRNQQAAPAPDAPGGAPAVVAGPLELAAVDVAVVQPRVLSRSLPLSGSMSPVVQATVKSKVSGEVEEVTVREGQDVRAGDVIARIDTRNMQAQYDRELAAVEKARADLSLAELNRDKNRTLLEQKYISQNTYEATESAYAASVASFKLAEAQARMIKISVDDAVIRAPFTGTIAKRLVQPGEKVSTDSSIVSIVDLRQMLLEAAVPAAEIPSVRVGQTAAFRVGGFGDREFVGNVQRINPVTVEGSRAITIYIAVANADRALKGGMFGQGELSLDSTEPSLSIPQMAARDEAGAAFVYTLESGKIVRKPVTLGPKIKGQEFVEVREGLAAGERVIVADIGDSKPGSEAFVRGEKGSGG